MKSQREYIRTSSRCPCCDSSDVEGGSVEIDAGAAFQSVDCAACGFAWTDNYKLIGYYFQPEDEPLEPQEAPSMEQQLSRHLSEEEEAERRAFSDAGGKAYP